MATGLASLAVIAPAVGSDAGEFECEEAVAHITDCCPGFEPRSVQCDYTFGCGDSEPGTPEITNPESNCILGLSCDQIRSKNICNTILKGGPVQCP